MFRMDEMNSNFIQLSNCETGSFYHTEVWWPLCFYHNQSLMSNPISLTEEVNKTNSISSVSSFQRLLLLHCQAACFKLSMTPNDPIAWGLNFKGGNGVGCLALHSISCSVLDWGPVLLQSVSLGLICDTSAQNQNWSWLACSRVHKLLHPDTEGKPSVS